MKKMSLALAIIMSFGVVGCANTDIYSGDVYTANHAKEVRAISYGTIMSMRKVKIQAEDREPSFAGIGGGMLGGLAGSTIGGGTGQLFGAAIGSIAGAVVGRKIEDKVNQVDALELVIRKDDKSEIVVVQKADPSFRVGARVRIVGDSDVNVSVL